MTPTFMKGKRKYIFCCNEEDVNIYQSILTQIKDENFPFQIIQITDSDLKEKLLNQKMGTYLYIAAPWERQREIEQMLTSIGYSKEEYQYDGTGQKEISVFCCRCHGITKKVGIEIDEEITCSHCQLRLVVSDHYSSLRNANLGYVAKL